MHCSLVNDDDRAESSSGCGRSVHSGLLPASWAEPTRLADGSVLRSVAGYTWKLLRRDQKLSLEAAKAVVRRLVAPLQVLDFQKENEYGEVSLVDLGWRGKSASEPRDR